MERFTNKYLLDWKDNNRRKPLIVRGARQVGKTWSIEQFGKKSFSSFIKVDFEKNPEFIQVFKENLDIKRILKDLELLIGKKITTGMTLLFFDEIQNSPKAISSLRYFYEEMPDLHVIAAGSLIDFELEEISFPVGRVQFMEMYPISFPEFLIANDREEAANQILKPPVKLSISVHNMLLDYLHSFFLTGGFPESVKAFLDSGSYMDSFEVQREIVTTYRMDFSKYAPHSNKECLNNVLENAAQHVGHQIKYARLSDGFTNPTIKKAFNLLTLARVLNRVTATSGAGFPLGVNASNKIFKSILADIGMMRPLSSMPLESGLTKQQLLSVYRGSMAEQFVGQEILAASSEKLFYWVNFNKNSTSEIDFLINKNGSIVPVEVKNASAGSLKSMHVFLQKFPQCEKGLVLSLREYETLPSQKLEFIPIYYAYFLASKNNQQRPKK